MKSSIRIHPSAILLATALLAWITLSGTTTAFAEPEAKPPEVSVTETKRFDSKCLNLKIGDVNGFVIEPLVAAVDGSKPWVWYAPTLEKYPGARMDWLFSRLLKQG